MRLLFLILAHDRPADLLELARTLIAGARDATVLIHFDARAPAADFDRLRAAAAGEPRIGLVAARTASSWGGFGLVEAPLNALAQAEAAGQAPDYVVLLSGACLPCRPIRQLERYLADNAGREFIEVADESWIVGGWRSERWRYRFWFDHRTQRPLEWLAYHVQRKLGLERRFPEGLTPRFGSQWWALTWDTCRAILTDIRRAPGRLAFFRSVWVPDEMLFQTYVHALVNPDEIAGFPLTHFQFTNRGKPVVFHDDHLDYVPTLPSFFVRKVAPQAGRLRAACLAVAGAADDGAALGRIGERRADYAAKVAAQIDYPAPGHVFYSDQLGGTTETVLARTATPYVVLLGPAALTGPLAARLAPGATGAPFTVLGELFAPGEVDLGPGRDALDGIGRGDAAIRDMHPALFLARVRARCPGVPVLRWSPDRQPALLAAVLCDPAALVVACLPYTGREDRDRQLLAWACLPALAEEVAAATRLPGLAAERFWCARVDALAKAETPWLDWLGRDAFYPALPSGRVLAGGVVALPWTIGREAAAPARQRLLARTLADCRFGQVPWFAPLAAALEGFWTRGLRESARPHFEPLSDAAAAILPLMLGTADAADGAAGEARPKPDPVADPAPDPAPATGAAPPAALRAPAASEAVT